MTNQLFSAAKIGNISMFRAALSANSINVVNECGETPLMVASEFGHLELVKFMLKRGADASLIDNDGRTASERASTLEMAKLFGSSTILGKFTDQNVVQNSLVRLAENIEAMFKESGIIFDCISENKKILIQDDLAKILFYIRAQEELSLLDGVGLTLSQIRISAKAQFDDLLPLLKSSTTERVLDFSNELLRNTSRYQPIKGASRELFSFDSLAGVEQRDADKLRKFFYEFSELIIKADGVINEQEVIALQYLSGLLFTQKASDAISDQSNTHKGISLDSTLTNLNGLVGMEDVKKDIGTLINIINANQLRKKEGLPAQALSMHAVFIGPPGTGKTTIARILAKIYHSLGVLNGDNFIEVDRSGLVAGYVGQTAIKTDEAINQALNGVLFVDEAYTLVRGSSDNDFGQEAIDILLKRMEDNRDKLVVIVAGYQEEMMSFINSNLGVKSRFNRFFYFKDYTPVQLKEIYVEIAHAAGFIFSDGVSEKLDELFELLYSRRDKGFGNARLVRNIFEKTFERHANRTATLVPITRSALTTLQLVDIPFEEFVGAV